MKNINAKKFLTILLLSTIIGGCILFFMPGEYEDILSKTKKKETTEEKTKVEVKIFILSPTNLQAFSSNNILITGKSESKNGIEKVFLRVGEQGEFGIVEGQETWQTNLIGLEENEYTVYAFCIDKSNNFSPTNSIKFFIDLTPPSVEIEFPTNNHILNINNITLSSAITDNLSGIDEIYLKVNNDNFRLVKKLSSISKNTTFSSNIQIPTEGSNSIEMYSIDKAGNYSTTNKVIFLASFSNPQITITTPNTNILKTNQTTILLSGTATDSVGIKNIFIKIQETGYQLQLDGGPTWNTNLSLSEGTNTINVYAVNLGNFYSITQSIKVIVATNSTIYLTSPTNNQIFTVSSIDINGTAMSYVGIKEVRVRIGDTGDFGVATGKENWNTNLSLSEGEYNLYYFSIDELNNYSATNQTRFYVGFNIYISSSIGDDSNIGILKSSPLKTIQTGLTKAYNLGIRTIILQQGEYTPNNGLNSSSPGVLITNSELSIVGGADNNFQYITGYSVLNGNYSQQVLKINNVSNLVIGNIVITRGGSGISYSGGGMVIENSQNLFLTNIIISNSTGLSGGGAYINTINNSHIYLSVISNYSYSTGGGIYIRNATNCVFYLNAISNSNQSSFGSAISIYDSYSNVIHGKVERNFSQGNGSIYIYNSTLNFISNEIINNYAYQYSGIYMHSSHSNRISSIISNNRTSTSIVVGGGISLEESHFNLLEGIVSSNNSPSGGGICLSSSHSNTISSTVFNNYSSSRGAGIYLISSHWNEIKGVISNNYTKTNGGGIGLFQSSSNIISGIITSNYSENYGGGIWATNSTNIIISGTISSNYGYYGGNYLVGANLIISNAIIHGNYAYQGGGLFISGSKDTFIINTTILNNNSGTEGGGIIIKDSLTLIISNSDIFNNNSQNGGGIRLQNSSNITILNSKIQNNSSTRGGGIRLEGNTITISNTQIHSNFAHTSGAGIYAEKVTNIIIVQCSFLSNFSTNTTLNTTLHFYMTSPGSITNLIISSNIIGGLLPNSIGIYEDGTADLIGHYLLTNVFITNTLNYLYREYTSDRKITNTPSDWININNPNLIDTHPSSTNNVATNI